MGKYPKREDTAFVVDSATTLYLKQNISQLMLEKSNLKLKVEELRQDIKKYDKVLQFVLNNYAQDVWESYLSNAKDHINIAFNDLYEDVLAYKEYSDIQDIKKRLGL